MQLTIEKLVYGGNGLARLEEAGGRRKTVFVPLVLPGERVEATIVEEKPGFARAKLDAVLQPSPQRTQPACPYFGECGGCHYQHANYDEQLRLKCDILCESVKRIAKVDLPEITVHASPPLHYRNRTRMKFAIVAGEKTKFVLGYRELGSHRLLPVRECPISSPLINRALAMIWDFAIVHDLPKGLAEIEFFAAHADQRILLELLTEPVVDQPAMVDFAQKLHERMPEIVGVAAGLRTRQREEAVAAPELEGVGDLKATTLSGQPYLDNQVGDFNYRVSAGSFFQTNRHQTLTLVDLVCRDAKGKLAMDLYAGVGLFTLPLAKGFERVVAVESSPSSFSDLKSNAPRNTKVLESRTEDFLSRVKQKPDFVVVDPPRAGLGKRAGVGLAKLAPKSIVYVSCDPSTLARDLPGLLSAGYRITQAHLVDLFPQTFHIETILKMER